MFPYLDREGGEFQFSKASNWKLVKLTDREEGGGEGKEECFPWGTWIDEGSKETEEALLWVC